MKQSDFVQFAHTLVGEEVQVVTTVGPYYGKLKFVGDDILGLRTHINGERVKMVIRIKEVVALFKVQVHDRRRGPVGWGGEYERGNQRESSSIKESSSFKY